jgi:sialate O-acetylesterase
MVFPVADAENGAAEQAASNHPLLRLFTIKDEAAAEPGTDVVSGAPYIWAASSPETVSKRHHGAYPSAACYFGGRDILVALAAKEGAAPVPIGLISAAWSGSAIESWMTPDMVRDGTPAALGGNGTCGGTVDPAAATAVAGTRTAAHGTTPRPGVTPQSHSAQPSLGSFGTMFNGMIAPLLRMRLRGIWWYQGEANDITHTDHFMGPWWYSCLFPSMITGWRSAFEARELPFYYVLLAAGHTSLLRESQMTAGKLNHTAFASALDLGATAAEEAAGFQAGYGARFSTCFCTRGCFWIPRMFAWSDAMRVTNRIPLGQLPLTGSTINCVATLKAPDP